MDSSTKTLMVMVLVLVLLIALTLLGSRFMVKRALNKVVKQFRDHRALDAASAKTIKELGFKSRSFLSGQLLKDYQPVAIDILIKSEVIQEAAEGKYFLSQEMLLKVMPGK